MIEIMQHPDIGEMDSLSLSKYFDLIPQSAMIFTSENQSFSAESLTVCYVNRVFLDSIGDSPLSEEEELEMGYNQPLHTNGVPNNFMTALQIQCVNPSA